MPNTNQQGTPLPYPTFEDVYKYISSLPVESVSALAATLIYEHRLYILPKATTNSLGINPGGK